MQQGVPWAAKTARREAACAGRTLPVARNALAKFGDLREARCRQTVESPGLGRICSPPLSAGLLFQGSGVLASLKWRAVRGSSRARRYGRLLRFRSQLVS